TVGVPNGFFREWIEGHFAAKLAEAAEAVAGRPLRLRFQISAEAEPKPAEVVVDTPGDGRAPAPTVTIPKSTPAPAHAPPWPERPRAQARPAKRLDDFVAGPGNRLALAAAVEMVHSAGSAFNPL